MDLKIEDVMFQRVFSAVLAGLTCLVAFFRKWLIQQYFSKNIDRVIENKKTKLNSLEKKMFSVCFKKELTGNKFSNKRPWFAAIFLVYFPLFIRSGGKSCLHKFNKIVNLAINATDVELYRKLLLQKSYKDCFQEEAHADFIDKLSAADILAVRGQHDDGENHLRAKLNKNEPCSLTYFAVTGQMSKLHTDIIKSKEGSINKLTLFVTSPLIITHKALQNLAIEYDPCMNFVDTSSQFLEDRTLDLIRRGIKILCNFIELYNFCASQHIEFIPYCFIEKHPRAKLVIVGNVYAQFKVTGLPYPNNMYRFGIETLDSSIVSQLKGKVVELAESSRVEKLTISATGVEGFKFRVLKELVQFLIINRYTCALLENNTEAMRRVLNDQTASDTYAELIRLFAGTQNCMLGYTLSIPPITSTAHINHDMYLQDTVFGVGNTHITVSMLFMQDDKMLLIKKKKGGYKNKWSVVAGHVDVGENPRDAVVREVYEELGIDVKRFSLIKYLDCVHGDLCKANSGIHSWYIYICHDEISLQDGPFDNDEILEICWTKFEAIDGLTMTDTAKKVLQQFNFG